MQWTLRSPRRRLPSKTDGDNACVATVGPRIFPCVSRSRCCTRLASALRMAASANPRRRAARDGKCAAQSAATLPGPARPSPRPPSAGRAQMCHPAREITMVHAPPRVVVTTAILAALNLAGCANFCGARHHAPMPYAHREPPPPPPPGAGIIDALPPCAPEHDVIPMPPPADVAHRAAPQRQDRGIGDGCLVHRGVAPPPPPPFDSDPFDAPDAADEPPGLPPDDSEFDAALQACATAEGSAAPFPQAPSPDLPPELLAQCLDAAGFAPPPPPFQPRR